MITAIGEILKDRIKDCNFAERVAGIVQTLSMQSKSKDNKTTITKKYPISCAVVGEDCGEDKSTYKDLIPDSSKRSVMYFEDIGGIQFLRRERNDLVFEAKIRLVVWLNQQKLGKNECSVSAPIMAHLIAKLQTTSPFNNPPYTKMSIHVAAIAQKNPAIFGKYTYDEAVMQFLMYPFDYFAIDLLVDYSINANCLEDFVVGVPDECNTH